MARRARELLLLVMLGASVPAVAGLFSDDEARARIQALAQENQKLREDLKALEERVGRLDAQLRAQGLIDLVQQVEGLKAELAKLRGQLEVNSHAVETLDKRSRDLYVDLDDRLRKLETGATPLAAPAAAAAGTPGAATDTGAESRAYEAAFNLFKIGNYQAAIAAFENFLKTYPASPLAANAQYWIGNSYSALRDYKTAIAAQQKLLSLYPNSAKVPDALLNMASAQTELGDRATARKTLEDLVARYPTSPAADIARKRLSSLK
ncbi:tol-pal system protein YbgF [Thiobacter aerophilum]|uniref:Cell division coordinator CpoB n=1 Tax=Thiobacter aerophilum TaxID=3121275 RepID=A0ABV0EHY5_9BURK